MHTIRISIRKLLTVRDLGAENNMRQEIGEGSANYVAPPRGSISRVMPYPQRQLWVQGS